MLAKIEELRAALPKPGKRCQNCGEKALSSVSANENVRADDGVDLVYEDVFTRCTSCGSEFYSRDQSLEHSRARAAVLCKHQGLLTPHAIIGIREQYGVSQSDLERVLGVGLKTVGRWERGTVCQGRAVDTLLDTFGKFPFVFWHWAERRGVRVKLPFGPRKWEAHPVSVVTSDIRTGFPEMATGDWDISKLKDSEECP